MRLNTILIAIILFAFFRTNVQEDLSYNILKNQPINFGGESGDDLGVNRLQNGRIIYKKVTVPNFKKGTDVKIKLTLRSNGDRWDKSGSCFIVEDLKQLSIINISKGEKEFPVESAINNKFNGIKNESVF